MPAPVSKATIEARLAMEAGALNAAYHGSHSFSPIWEERHNSLCNWSSTYSCRGSTISLREMREALERVQEKYPIADFQWQRRAAEE